MSFRSAARAFRLLILAGTAIAPATDLRAEASAQSKSNSARDGDPIEFSAERVTLVQHPDSVEAAGDVRARRGDQRLRADAVTWDREAGLVTADGQVAMDNGDGRTLYAEHAVLDEDIHNGTVIEPLVTMKGTLRLAGRSGRRRNGITTLERASYTACHVLDSTGCPKAPFWTVTASRIVHDENTHRIRYKNPRLNLLGMPVLWLPGLSHGDGTGDASSSGLLVPDVTYTATKGVEFAQPYYLRASPDRDLLITPHVYSRTLPMVEVRYRRLLSGGAFSIAGSLTKASKLPTDVLDPLDRGANGSFRGAIDARAKYQFGPEWSFDASIRIASDRGYLRRYDISGEDRLRSIATLQRIAEASYLSISGYGFQILRFSDSLEDQAFAVPVVDYRRRVTLGAVPGAFEFGAGLVSLVRDNGQNVSRLGTNLRWSTGTVDTSGRLWKLTALMVAQGYRVTSATNVTPAEYRGRDGYSGRGIGAASIDLAWPLVAPLAGGTQTLTPKLQIASSHTQTQGTIPNEDSRGADFDETALFALNPLPGQDRWLGGTRMTYGVDWRLDRPRWAVSATAGQIVFLARPDVRTQSGVGLSGRSSDFLAGGTLRVDRDWRLSAHARLDDRTATLRRLDVDGGWTSGPVEALVTYSKLNRGDRVRLGADFPNHEEIAAGLSVRFARYWTASGGAVVNLQGRGDDPLSFGNGFQPVRRRLGLSYDDECISIGVSWKREYDVTGTSSGDNFKLRFSIKTLGR